MELTPSGVADRVIGVQLPYAPLYKNVALLQAARGPAEKLQPGDLVDESRWEILRILRGTYPTKFMEKRWDDIVADARWESGWAGKWNGVMGRNRPALYERDRLEFGVLNLLATNVKPALPINEHLIPTVSRAATMVMGNDTRKERQLACMSAGIDVLETALTTAICGILSAPNEEALFPIVDAEQRTNHGALVTGSLREVARRLQCEDILFENDA